MNMDAQHVYRERVVLTDAQIKALPTAPIELLPFPLAGASIVPLLILARFDCPVAYTNLDGTTCIIYTTLGNGVPTSSFDENGPRGGFLVSPGVGDVLVFTPIAAVDAADMVAAVPVADPTDKPLTLNADNGASGDWTGGDPGNTITVTVLYVVLTP